MPGSMRISQTFAKKIQELGENRILEIIEIHGRRNEWHRERYKKVVKPVREKAKKEAKVKAASPVKDGKEPLHADVT